MNKLWYMVLFCIGCCCCFKWSIVRRGTFLVLFSMCTRPPLCCRLHAAKATLSLYKCFLAQKCAIERLPYAEKYTLYNKVTICIVL